MRTVFLKIYSTLQLGLLLAAALISQATAGFTSIYAFGDGVCTTTSNPSPSSLYYGNRFCNGRIWIEVLAQWQGVTYDGAKNESSYGHDSVLLQDSLNDFDLPADANTSMFIVWCNDADFVNMTLDEEPPYDLSQWNTKIGEWVANHVTAVNTLYDEKGARFMIMPNAVNIASVPYYNNFNATSRNFIRDRVMSFNDQFAAAMNGLMATKTGLKIFRPDMFSFFEQVLANPGAYGLVNPTPTAANWDINVATIALPGATATAGSPGTNYVFWDSWHPTAKFQMHLAAYVQQHVFPVKANSLSLSGGNVQVQLANIPLGRAGSIQGSANLQPPWADDYPFTEPLAPTGSTTQTYVFPASGPKRFYRAAFPVVWTWP